MSEAAEFMFGYSIALQQGSLLSQYYYSVGGISSQLLFKDKIFSFEQIDVSDFIAEGILFLLFLYGNTEHTEDYS